MGTRLPVLALFAAALLVAGCGGGSSSAGSSNASSTSAATTSAGTTSTGSNTGESNSGGGKPLAAAQLVVKANAICARLSKELIAAKDVVRTSQDIMRVAPRRAAVEQTAVADLSKLTPPASMANDFQQIVGARRTLAEDTAKLGEYAATKNTQAERPLYAATAGLLRQMAATAQRAGLKDCGRLG